MLVLYTFSLHLSLYKSLTFAPMKISIFCILIMTTFIHAKGVPPGAFGITRIHYDGGGDWYADPSSLPNLLVHLSDHTNMVIDPLEKRAKIGDDIFSESVHLVENNTHFTN